MPSVSCNGVHVGQENAASLNIDEKFRNPTDSGASGPPTAVAGSYLRCRGVDGRRGVR